MRAGSMRAGSMRAGLAAPAVMVVSSNLSFLAPG